MPEAQATVVEVTDTDFQTVVLESAAPVVVDFWAPWCGPCRIVNPVVEELSREYNGKVRFAKMNTDENEQSAMQFGIQVLPTLVIFQDGREVNRLIGFSPKEQLRRQIDRSLQM
jgi:thioredoxin 1